jgi:hypothetical protein
MPPIICRTLRYEFRLHAQTAQLREQLRFMEIAPELPDFSLEPVDIEVVEKDGFCAARLPDGDLIEGSPLHLMANLHDLIYHDIEQGESDAIFVHGATVLIDGKSVLLAGQKGCGKTTLTLHLIAAGCQVEGDEHLLIRAADVVARPRTLRVKPGSLALVPAFARQAEDAAWVPAWDGTPVRAISPAIGGRQWMIRPHALDAIVFLTGNHGGRSVADRLPIDQAFRRLMGEVVRWPVNIGAAASRLRALLASAQSHELLLGSLGGAEWHLRKLLAP